MLLSGREYAFPMLLAPMAGVTDLPFRTLCREAGCDFTFTEMVSAKGLYFGGSGSARLLETGEADRPLGVQLFGADAQIIAKTVSAISREHAGEISLIDLNMGCPVRKVTANGEGSALMRDLPLASRIIEAAVKASDLPVSVKFRKGFDASHVNAVEFARMAEESGACHVTVHGRTREQMYSGKADWDIIAEVKRHVRIPVVGNGDIFSAADALAMRKTTGCDGVMIARGAEGNPFLFAELKAALADQPYTEPTVEQRIDAALEHARRLVAYKGQRGIIEMRKHAAWYLRGQRNSGALRARVNGCNTLAELEALFSAYRREIQGL